MIQLTPLGALPLYGSRERACRQAVFRRIRRSCRVGKNEPTPVNLREVGGPIGISADQVETIVSDLEWAGLVLRNGGSRSSPTFMSKY
jgi:hypothetical protein